MAEVETFDQFVLSVGRETWEVFRRDALMLVLGATAVMVLSILSVGLVAGPVTIGLIEMVRTARRGEPVELGLLFSRFDTFVASAIAIFLIWLAILLGTFLLVVPGLLAAVFSIYAMHALAYEPLGAIGALRRSFELVRDNFLSSLVLVLALAAAQTIGGMVVFGVLLTAPLSIIALTISYERLAYDDAQSAQVLTI